MEFDGTECDLGYFQQIRCIDSKTLLSMDDVATVPALIPGDVVETPNGAIAVIVEAMGNANGHSITCEAQLRNIEVDHGQLPGYSITFIKSYDTKEAWWHASEFKRVVSLSPSRGVILIEDSPPGMTARVDHVIYVYGATREFIDELRQDVNSWADGQDNVCLTFEDAMEVDALKEVLKDIKVAGDVIVSP